jgi:hypothetical protein
MMGLLASQLGSMKNPQILLRQSLPRGLGGTAPPCHSSLRRRRLNSRDGYVIF